LNVIKCITIIGTGNVASQIADKFSQEGYLIDAIYGRPNSNGNNLAKQTNSIFINEPRKLPKSSDLYVVALKDDCYMEVLKELDLAGKLIIHTSGSLKSDSLAPISNRYGCLYPLQTINKSYEVNWDNVSFYIEANNENDEKSLTKLCEKLSFKYQKADSTKRRNLHIAAVATNNFTYHLLSTIREYCEKNNLNYNDLKPLLEQSMINSFAEDNYNLQTGPAVRNDRNLIEKHLNDLGNDKNLKEIYELFTHQIIKKHYEL
jgi:predicted short-subunit dehydrogenase-like oxidoreductase (DUF2520 family)